MTEIWPNYSRTREGAPQEAPWTSPGACPQGPSGSKVILEPHAGCPEAPGGCRSVLVGRAQNRDCRSCRGGFRQRAALFHPEISIWLGFGLNVGLGSAGLGPYCAHKIEKRGKEDLLVVLELF